jgi:cytochrome b561
MRLRNSTERYGAVAQLLHWLVVLGFAAQFALAYYMENLPNSPFKIEMYNLHKSIGLTILVIAVARLGWRWLNPVPALPAGRPRWEHLASRASHIGLYALLFAQPITGLIQVLYSRFPSMIWGWKLPRITVDNAVSDAFGAAHASLQWAIVALVAIHAGAALRHHIVLRDDVLRRMLPGRRVQR